MRLAREPRLLLLCAELDSVRSRGSGSPVLRLSAGSPRPRGRTDRLSLPRRSAAPICRPWPLPQSRAHAERRASRGNAEAARLVRRGFACRLGADTLPDWSEAEARLRSSGVSPGCGICRPRRRAARPCPPNRRSALRVRGQKQPPCYPRCGSSPLRKNYSAARPCLISRLGLNTF